MANTTQRTNEESKSNIGILISIIVIILAIAGAYFYFMYRPIEVAVPVNNINQPANVNVGAATVPNQPENQTQPNTQ